jgi:nitroreductase
VKALAMSSAEAWTARYGTSAAIPAALTLNPVLEQLFAHRSVRAYLPKPLPDGALEKIIAAAQSASTSSNLQTWSVVAVEDPERKARLSALCANQAQIRHAPLFLVWLADLHRLDAAASARQWQAEGLEYLEAMLIGVIDAALAAQNAAVALESLGLSCVYIGAARNHIDQMAEELRLPPRVFPIFGMCIGFADPTRPAGVKPRLPQAAVLHREQYNVADQPAAMAKYDALMAQFYASQGLPQNEWSSHSVKRVLTPAALNGRQHLVAALQQLGFVLR